MREQNLQYSKRLYNAKEISKPELDDINLGVLKTKKQIAELNQILSENVNWLSFYTGETYGIDDLKICDIENYNFDLLAYFDYTKSIYLENL